MTEQLSHIEFYYPRHTEKISSKQHLADLIVAEMKERKSLGYSGHASEDSLRESLINHLGEANIAGYKPLTEAQEKQIEAIITTTVERCNKTLPVPTKNFVFVFPYFPGGVDEVFGGVMGVAPYSCVLHLFLDPTRWTEEVLENTVTHEINHTIYYYHHYDSFGNYTVLDEMLIEGLAECFREQIIDPTPSPWASALARQQAGEALAKMSEETLVSTDKKLIKGVLFGNDDYERWTGYSLGYWLAKNFIEQNKDLSWEEIMKTSSHMILESFNKKEV